MACRRLGLKEPRRSETISTVARVGLVFQRLECSRRLPSRRGMIYCQSENGARRVFRIQRFDIVKCIVMLAVFRSLTGFEDIPSLEKRQHGWFQCCFRRAACPHHHKPPTERCA